MPEISPEAEAAIASMTDAEYSAFTAKVRAPDGTVALRTAAAQLLTGPALDDFVNFADVSKFTGADGNIDTHRVLSNIRATHGNALTDGYVAGGRQAVNHGQASGGNGQEVPRSRPGDGGRLAAAKKHGAPLDEQTAATAARIRGTGPGSAGAAAAAKRFSKPSDNMASLASGAKR